MFYVLCSSCVRVTVGVSVSVGVSLFVCSHHSIFSPLLLLVQITINALLEQPHICLSQFFESTPTTRFTHPQIIRWVEALLLIRSARLTNKN